MIIQDYTQHLSLPLPHPQNLLEDDVLRLRDALMLIDVLIAQKADLSLVNAEFAALIDSAPEALNTLRKLAAALANDKDFAVHIAGQLADVGVALVNEEASVAKRFKRLKNFRFFGITL